MHHNTVCGRNQSFSRGFFPKNGGELRQVLYYHSQKLEDGSLLSDYGYNYDGYLFLYELFTVTYKVYGGTWADGTTKNKTENVVSGSSPANVPTGMIANYGYKKDGAWDVDAADAGITEDTTFTYRFRMTYSGRGDGTEESPYEITTFHQFLEVEMLFSRHRQDNLHAVLMQDIWAPTPGVMRTITIATSAMKRSHS